jgi:3-oxoacyl-[acyl-carrier-protein] synthase-3
MLMPAFGAGLTFCAHLVRWGERVTPIANSDAELPPSTRSALEIVNGVRAIRAAQGGRSEPGLVSVEYAEARAR